MSDLPMKHLGDGLCVITDVTEATWGPGTAIAELKTDLGERFAIFSRPILEEAQRCQSTGMRVQLTTTRTKRSHYVSGIARFDPQGDTHPCLTCGATAYKHEMVNGDEGRFVIVFYECPQCHRHHFVSRLPRVLAPPLVPGYIIEMWGCPGLFLEWNPAIGEWMWDAGSPGFAAVFTHEKALEIGRVVGQALILPDPLQRVPAERP